MGHGQSSVRDWEREAAAWRARAEQLQATVNRLRSLAVAGESAGFLAHELNNLFTPVVGYCHAASADGASEDLRDKALKRALTASERVGELSRAILGLAGSAEIEPDGAAWCDVAESVAAALLVLGVERWKKEGIEVRVDVPRGTLASAPACVVQQVVMNLVLNARRAMDGRRGAIEVVCRVVGGLVRVEIRDEGRGMDQKVIERLTFITNSDDCKTMIERRRGDLAGASGSLERGARGEKNGSFPGARGLDALRGGPLADERGAAGERYQVDVQELARSGSINGQARWGVRVRESEKRQAESGNEERSGGEAGVVPVSSRAARKKQEKTIARLRGGKLAPSASPIKVWDAGEVARELRSSEQRTTNNENEGGEAGHGGTEERGGNGVGEGLRIGADGKEVVNGELHAGNQKGSGLGLALCVELVTRFGGRMSASSVVGEGTTVVVELPVAQAQKKRAA